MARRATGRLRELAEPPKERTPRYIAGEDEEGPILSTVSFVLVSIAAFLLLTAAAIWFGNEQVESAVEERALRYLRTAGYDNVIVLVSGQDVELAGSVTTEEEVEAIPAAVETLQGIRSVTNSLELEVPVVPEGPVKSDPLVLAYEGGTVTVAGTVSTDAVRTRIIEALSAGGATVADESLVTRPGVAAEDSWLAGVLSVAERLGETVDTYQIIVNPDASVATVSAELETRQERADVRRAAEETLAAGPLGFVSALTVADAPPPPPPEQVEELQEDLDDLIAGKVVEFELNSDQLTTEGRELLDGILEALRLFPDVPVEIAGHADSQGDDSFNMDLSFRRAEAVLAYLVAGGASPDRFAVVGYGETRPIADNSTEEGRARNRRIEFIAQGE